MLVPPRTAIELLSWRPRLRLPEWVERHRYVHKGRRPGRWRNDTLPLLTEIMTVRDDPDVEEIVVMGCARLGKTEASVINPMLRDLEQGREILFITATDALYRRTWTTKILPALRRSESLQWLSTADELEGRFEERRFPSGAILSGGGAKSLGKLTGVDAESVYLDELDKQPQQLGSEGGAQAQAPDRLAAFEGSAKIVKCCTPTTPEGAIAQAWEAGDRRRPFVQCPRCGRFHVLHVGTEDGIRPKDEKRPLERLGPGGLRWADDDPAGTAHYVCPHCGGRIEETEKTAMAATVEWRAERPCEGIASFWFNRLYSPWNSWSRIALRIAKAIDGGDLKEQEAIVQRTLGLPWHTPNIESVRIAPAVVKHRVNYLPRGQAPERTERLCGYVDVGKWLLHFGVMAFRRGAVGAVVDYGVQTVRSPRGSDDRGDERQVQLAIEEALEAVRTKWETAPCLTADGQPLQLDLALVDFGWRTMDAPVFRFCRRHPRFMPARAPQTFAMPAPTRARLPGDHWFRELHSDGFWTVILDSSFWKMHVHEGFMTPEGTPGALTVFGDDPLEHSEFARQVCAEIWVEEYSEGRDVRTARKGAWVAKYRQNHFLDVAAGCCVAASVFGVGLVDDPPAEKPLRCSRVPAVPPIRTRY